MTSKRSDEMASRRAIDPQPVLAVVRREVLTIARTRAYAVLTVVLALVLFGVVERSDALAAGYVPTAVDLLLPLEVLVPIVAVALGYRAFTGDNDDLAVLSTYPVSRVTLVVGVFLGRLMGLAAVVGLPLVAVGVAVAWTPGVESAVFATSGGVDSPIFFVRFVALTVCFAGVVLAVTLAASVIAQSGRVALALAAGVFLAVVAGGDLLVITGLVSGSIDEGSLEVALAAAPNSAYRGLVLELVVGVATDEGGFADPAASAASLLAWTVLGLAVTVFGLSRDRVSDAFSKATYRLRQLW